MGSSVQVKEALLIAPANPTPNQILSLSALDSQLFIRFTIEYLLVYRCKSGPDRRSTAARVKAALSKALVPYYPLAGRVRAKKFGSGLEVVCRSQGALFIEAVSDFTIGDFGRAPKYVGEWRKLLTVQVDDVLKGGPPLVVQLTWLKDGNAALAVGVNHCISDGVGSCEFLNSFADSARLGTKCADFRPRPVWERHLLDPMKSKFRKAKRASHPEFGRVPDLCGFLARFNNERLAPTSIVFDSKSLQELKKLASSTSPPTELKQTSFDVLSAHVWRSWARALNFPPNQTLKLLFSINFRNRVTPSIPGGFYGNAFVLGCAQTTVKDLTEMGLGHAAMLVKRAKDRVDNEYVNSVLESVSESSACPDSVGVLILSQWSRLGLDRVDFGLGRPALVSSVCCDRYCLFLPVAERKDAVKVMVAVPSSGVEKYEFLVRSIGS